MTEGRRSTTPAPGGAGQAAKARRGAASDSERMAELEVRLASSSERPACASGAVA